MSEEFKALKWLRGLDNFSDPVGPSAQLQTQRLMQEVRKIAEIDPNRTFRMSEDGPDKTIAEILAELDADEAAVAALRRALNEDLSGKQES